MIDRDKLGSQDKTGVLSRLSVEALWFRFLVCLEPLRSWAMQIVGVLTSFYIDTFLKSRGKQKMDIEYRLDNNNIKLAWILYNYGLTWF